MSTPAQQAANRANAQLSTGPKTAEGKQKIAHNAVKTALTGATVLLPTDDVAHYQKHIAKTFELWQPANQREEFLVQSIADTEWRLLRIPALQAATLALGRIKHADLFSDQPEDLRPMLIEAHLQEACGRQLRNLSLQESRLTRKREKDIAELTQLQSERKRVEQAKINAAVETYLRHRGEPFDPAEFGFDFSVDEIEMLVARRQYGCRNEEFIKKQAARLRAERLAA